MNRFFSSVRSQVLSISIIQSIAVATLLFILYYWNVQSQAYDDSVKKARSIVSVAEAVRGDMAKKWELGIFSQKQMKEWADQGKIDHVLSAVPIVAAWKSVRDGTDSTQFDVKVPKFQPRNASNAPDEIESAVLKEFESNSAIQEKVVHDKSNNTVRYFKPIRLTQDCMLCHGDPKTSRELWGNDRGIDGTGNAMENWHVGEVHGAFEIIQKLDQSQMAANMAVFKGLLFYGVLVTATLFVFAWLISRSVTTPISKCVDALRCLADGNLKAPIETGARGEIGVLQEGMITMQAKLGGMIRKLDSYSRDLSAASDEMHRAAEQLSSTSNTTQQTSSSAAAAAEQMSTNVNQMSQSSSSIAEIVNGVSSAVNELRTACTMVDSNVRDTRRVSEDAVRIAQQSGKQFVELSDAAAQIGSVSQLIQEIAEQTNLLALNATIEAARAGNAGDGFAVVANEVKSLAKQTAHATGDIRKRIEGMQSASAMASISIKKIEDVIQSIHKSSNSIVDAIEQQGQATESISNSVERTLTEITAFSNNASESAIATREVAKCIHTVESSTREVAANATQTRQHGAQLKNIAGDVTKMLKEFSV